MFQLGQLIQQRLTANLPERFRSSMRNSNSTRPTSRWQSRLTTSSLPDEGAMIAGRVVDVAVSSTDTRSSHNMTSDLTWAPNAGHAGQLLVGVLCLLIVVNASCSIQVRLSVRAYRSKLPLTETRLCVLKDHTNHQFFFQSKKEIFQGQWIFSKAGAPLFTTLTLMVLDFNT